MNKTSFTSPFLICVTSVSLSFLFFPLIVLPGSLVQCWIEMVRMNKPYCQFQENIRSFNINNNLSPKILFCFVLFSKCPLLNWETYLLFQVYWQILSKFTLDVVSYIDQCSNVNQHCIPRINPHLFMIYHLFYTLINLVCQNFVWDFCSHVHEEYWSIIFLFYNRYAWFWCRVNIGFI